MKTIYIILVHVLILSYACNSGKHLNFNTIPIDGSLGHFASGLATQGFTLLSHEYDTLALFKGTYLNRDCDLQASAAREGSPVYRLKVNMPRIPHDSIKHAYAVLQKHYTARYGRGISKYQQFNNSSRFLFNEPRLERQPSIGDYTKFTTNMGTVILKVEPGYFSVTYTDKINSSKAARERRSTK